MRSIYPTSPARSTSTSPIQIWARREFGQSFQRDALLSPTPFERATVARMVDEDSAHRLRGSRKEMRPAPPVDARSVRQAFVRLVNQGRGLQRVTGALTPQIAARESPQLIVDERHQQRG